MALTSGERSALWRKRQRENETKHEEYKRKERERYKKRKALGQLKPIKDLTEREKRQKRRNWKTHAKNKRDKEKSIKTALASICTPPNSPEGAYRAQFRLKIELNKERRLKNKYKTRYYRLIRSQKEDGVEETVKNIMSSQKTMKSTLTLYCLLVNNLRTKYASSNRKTKQILKSLVFRESMLRKYKLKSYTGKATGISMRETRTRESNFRLKQIAIRRTIESFFTRDDNSRFKAGKKSTRTKRKRKNANYSMTLLPTFTKSTSLKISYSLFARLKPFWVIQASEKDRQTCLCKFYENPLMKLNKFNFEKAIEHRDLRKLIKDITCNDRQKSGIQDESRERIQKNDTGISKTNITVREPETGTISTLVDELQTDIELYHTKEIERNMYRCKTNFYLFATKLFDLGFSEGGSWNFMEAGHGKGAPDGVGAALKRNADALVNTHNRDVICAADLVDCKLQYL
ncbi:LOW QUALITY PROTEIN: hypothetical protein MAR_027751 [Mya arenaria]|uniref:Uncharacterized protein n=1 Tax=Mya arenaria TaxID=6604 RepID=A0ABY7F2K7_MYAAR|nr:LOW QUALITY PROTEIN: hypothetical protein MAR_027751 [Mya arenaria]